MRVFLSYSRRDSAFADRLGADLARAGHDVWLDTEDIVGGEAWRTSIAAGIEGADVVLVLLSPDAVASPNVERELTIADESRKRVLPVLVLPCELPAGFRYALAGVQHIDFAHQPHAAATAQLLTALGTPGASRRAGRPGLSTVARRRLGLGAATLLGVIVAVVIWQVIVRRGDGGGAANGGAFVGKDIVESFFNQPADRVRSQISAQGAFTFPGDATSCSNSVRRGSVARITRVDDDLRAVGDVLDVNGRAGREGNPLREPARLVITLSTGPCRN